MNKKELKAKRAKLVAYCMDNPSLTMDIDYKDDSQRLDYYRKSVAKMKNAELDAELEELGITRGEP